MKLNFIPLVTALLPAIAVHLCYLLAAYFGHVPWCFPYVDGCVSISATGRQSPESYVFRASMMPTAVLMIVYWKLSYEWLVTLGSRMAKGNRTMLYLGVVGGLGLILYTTVLGSVGDIFRLQRRIGVTLFYVLTFLAQFLLTIQVMSVARTRPSLMAPRIFRGLAAILAAVAILGITSFVLGAYYEDYRDIEDAFEWVITLLILMHILVTHFAWRDSGFRASFAVSER